MSSPHNLCACCLGEHGIAQKNALFGIVRIQNGTSRIIGCARRTVIPRRAVMANREQRGNKEKKKPKADKKSAQITTKPPAYVEPQLVRKPHKGKEWT